MASCKGSQKFEKDRLQILDEKRLARKTKAQISVLEYLASCVESHAHVHLAFKFTCASTNNDTNTVIFGLQRSTTIYTDRLGDLGVEKAINKTRLKNRSLEHFSEAEEQTDGRHVVIFKEEMKDIIRDTLKCRDFDEDALNLARARVLSGMF